MAWVVLLLLFGMPMIVLIPPGAGYDEEDHLVRVWELSSFSLIPGQMSPQELKYPLVFRDFAYRQQGSSGVIDDKFWQTYLSTPLYENGFVRRKIDTKSVYSPPLLLPQAVAMRLGRSLNLPALPLFYLCRLAGLLSYLILVWLAICLIPYGKWLLLVLALVPMALFQAATISPDAISNGIGFLFIAGCMRIAQRTEIGRREVSQLILLTFLLFLAKLNLIPIVLLPFLLIPPSRYANKRTYLILLAGTLILFMIEVLGWNMIAAARANPLLANEADPKAQFLYIWSDPLSFFVTVIKDLVTNGWTYLQGWINGYGYYYWTPPAIVSFIFILGLGSVLLSDSIPEQFQRRQRGVFLLVFLASYLATVASLYVSFTPVGADRILGVQGRYFIPLVLLLFLALVRSSGVSKSAPFSSKWMTTYLITALSLNVLAIFFSFHIPCGTTYVHAGLCYQPLSRDFTETRPSPPISNEMSLTQDFRVACNGFAELRILLNPSTGGDSGSTHFLLQDMQNNQALFDGSLANSEVSEQIWYPLRFDPVWDSAGKEYTLYVRGLDTSPGNGIQLLYTAQPEFNLGTLYEGKQVLDNDLVLQYGCVTGLRKIWLTGNP